MPFVRLLLAVLLTLASAPAFAWPYEVYRAPKDFSGYRVTTTLDLPYGTAELLQDARITADNLSKVRLILAGKEAGDAKLQDSFDREDSRWAIVRFTPKDGGTPDVVVLDHALATLAASDMDGSGVPALEVMVDYLAPHKGRITLFMQPIKGKLEPVQYVDAAAGYRMQIELIDAAKAWWKRSAAGKASEFLLVDGRFPDRTDLMRIRWDGSKWLRLEKKLPGGAIPTPDKFPAAEAFP